MSIHWGERVCVRLGGDLRSFGRLLWKLFALAHKRLVVLEMAEGELTHLNP